MPGAILYKIMSMTLSQSLVKIKNIQLVDITHDVFGQTFLFEVVCQFQHPGVILIKTYLGMKSLDGV